MNRLIILGNGFDLAHGLPTSYNDFIGDYFATAIKKAVNNDLYYEDDLIRFKIKKIYYKNHKEELESYKARH